MGVGIIGYQGYLGSFVFFFQDDNFMVLLLFNNHHHHLAATYQVIHQCRVGFFPIAISTIEVVVVSKVPYGGYQEF